MKQDLKRVSKFVSFNTLSLDTLSIQWVDARILKPIGILTYKASLLFTTALDSSILCKTEECYRFKPWKQSNVNVLVHESDNML